MVNLIKIKAQAKALKKVKADQKASKQNNPR